MKIILETPRLLLGEFEITDAESFFELNNDPDVVCYTGDVAFKNLDEAKALIENFCAPFCKATLSVLIIFSVNIIVRKF